MYRPRITHALLGWILRRVVRYRVDIVRSNLQRAFPSLSPSDLQSLERRYYAHIGRLLVELLRTTTRSRLQQKIRYAPGGPVDAWLAADRSVIATMGHLGNWEWTGAFLGTIFPDHFCALFRRIKSPWLNRLQRRRRALHARFLLDSNKPGDMVRLLNTHRVLLLLIADQNPGSDQGLIWLTFLGQPTAFSNGPEHLALRYRLPVAYIHTLPLADGRYDFRWEIIWDGIEPVDKGEITRRYAEKLEANIREAPYAWLWSHRRWKRTPPPHRPEPAGPRLH